MAEPVGPAAAGHLVAAGRTNIAAANIAAAAPAAAGNIRTAAVCKHIVAVTADDMRTAKRGAVAAGLQDKHIASVAEPAADCTCIRNDTVGCQNYIAAQHNDIVGRSSDNRSSPKSVYLPAQ